MIAKPVVVDMPGFSKEEHAPGLIVLRRDDLSEEQVKKFVEEFARACSEPTPTTRHGGISRGEVKIIAGTAKADYVLRPSRRGGLARYLWKDRYLTFSGRTRVEDEVLVLSELLRQGVRVCRPVCAIIERASRRLPFPEAMFCYRSSLLTEKISPSRTIAEIAEQAGPQFYDSLAEYSRRAGEETKKMLAAGVFHSDLHFGNVLVDKDGEVVLIDFDKAQRFVAEEHELYLARTIERWQRALNKHAPQLLKCCGSSFVDALMGKSK